MWLSNIFNRKVSSNIERIANLIEDCSKQLAKEIQEGSPNLVVDHRSITVGMLVVWLRHYVANGGK